jgi:hypothetical protein
LKKYLREKVGDSKLGRNDDDDDPSFFSFSSSSNDFSTKASSISIVDAPESIEPLGEGENVDENVGVAIIINVKIMYYTRSKKRTR